LRKIQLKIIPADFVVHLWSI